MKEPLELPRGMKKMLNAIPKNVILRQEGGDCGYRVIITTVGHGKLQLAGGWEDVVKAHHLEPGKVMIFMVLEDDKWMFRLFSMGGIEEEHGCKNCVQDGESSDDSLGTRMGGTTTARLEMTPRGGISYANSDQVCESEQLTGGEPGEVGGACRNASRSIATTSSCFAPARACTTSTSRRSEFALHSLQV